MADGGTSWINAQASDNANIEINFADIENLRTKFIEHEAKGEEVIKELLKLDQELKSYWDSDAHNAFTKSIESYETAFRQEIKNALTYIGDIMANAAQRTKKYEEKMTSASTLDPSASSSSSVPNN